MKQTNDYNHVKHSVKHQPHDTGKVVIGRFYEPKMRNSHTTTYEEEFWQIVLTSKPLSESIHAKDLRLACVIVICMVVALIVWAVA
jgi:hypothetical protein